MSGWPGGLCDSKVAEALEPAQRAKLTLWPGQKAWRTFPGPRPACLGGLEWKKGGEDGSESFFPGLSFTDCRINKPLYISWSESPSSTSLSSTLLCFPSLTPKPLQKVAFDQQRLSIHTPGAVCLPPWCRLLAIAVCLTVPLAYVNSPRAQSRSSGFICTSSQSPAAHLIRPPHTHPSAKNSDGKEGR